MYKYFPIIYTIYRARKHLIYYFLNMSLFWLPILIYLFFSWEFSFNLFLNNLGAYILLCVWFLLFYEIWYLYNDYFSTRKEKKPTLNIKDDLSAKFVYIQFFIRIILTILFLILFNMYYKELTLYAIFFVIFILFIFFVHNIYRNLFANFLTLNILKVSKLFIIIPIIYNIPIFENIIIISGLLCMMENFFDSVLGYNEKAWWTNRIDRFYFSSYMLIALLVFYFLTKQWIIVIYIIYYLMVFIKQFPKNKAFWKKNKNKES